MPATPQWERGRIERPAAHCNPCVHSGGRRRSFREWRPAIRLARAGHQGGDRTRYPNGIVDGGMVARILSGVLALGGAWVVTRTVCGLMAGGSVEGWTLAMVPGSLRHLAVRPERVGRPPCHPECSRELRRPPGGRRADTTPQSALRLRRLAGQPAVSPSSLYSNQSKSACTRRPERSWHAIPTKLPVKPQGRACSSDRMEASCSVPKGCQAVPSRE